MSDEEKDSREFSCGLKISIAGNYRDLVWFYIEQIKIAEDNIRDGNDLDLYKDVVVIPELAGDLTIQTIGIRHGRLRDLLYAYVILGRNVYRSPRWRNLKPGIEHIHFSVGDCEAVVGQVNNRRGWLRFDLAARQWQCMARDDDSTFEGSSVLLPFPP